jgi:hypothetical protein
MCLAAVLLYPLIGKRIGRRLVHLRQTPPALQLVETAQAAPMPEPAKAVFRLHCGPSAIPSVSTGATVHPELMPPDLIGKVVVRGAGALRMATPAGCSFLKGGQQNENTAFLEFSGRGVGELFDVSTSGSVSFTIQSTLSFAERLAVAPQGSHQYRQVFDVYEETANQMGLSITPHEGFLALIYAVGPASSGYYFVPKGQEDQFFGKGVTLKVKIAWDGRGMSQLLLNGKVVESRPYTRSRPVWSATSSFSIGSRDQHEFSGGYFSFPDILTDFTVESSGAYKDTVPPQLSWRFPASGQKFAGSVILHADASDDDGIARVRFLADGAPVCTTLSYPYICFWDTHSLTPGPHTVVAEAADTAGNITRKELAVTTDAGPTADREPPAPVPSLFTVELRAKLIRIAWLPATDNVGVTQYRVYRDRSPVGTVSAEGSQKQQRVLFSDSAVESGHSYTYQVEALDAAGNAAPLSAPLTLTAAGGNVLHVGPGQQYALPCAAILAARPGDTVEIDAAGNGSYDGDVCGWNTDNVTIRGVNGRPRIESRGRNASGKGVWVIAGRGNTVENIEISGATAGDRNGAAIRVEGPDTTIRHAYFHHNQNGILVAPGPGSLLIEFSEFAYNGDGSGQTHNLYVNAIERLIFRYNYSHHVKIGHLLKSRALESDILYNRLTDETGTASYEMDFPNAGRVYVVGNIVQQSAKTDNFNIVSCGLEGLHPNSPNTLYFVNNTVVNDRADGNFFLVAPPLKVFAVNNIFAGGKTGLGLPPGAVKINNLTTDPGFVNPAALDYRLKPGSAARGAAVDPGPALGGAPSLKPEFVYTHPTGASQLKPGTKGNIGAF